MGTKASYPAEVDLVTFLQPPGSLSNEQPCGFQENSEAKITGLSSLNHRPTGGNGLTALAPAPSSWRLGPSTGAQLSAAAIDLESPWCTAAAVRGPFSVQSD